MRRPAKLDVFEFHNGADTTPVMDSTSATCSISIKRELTILNQYIQAPVYEQIRVEDDKTEAHREHIIARSELQELSNSMLYAIISTTQLSRVSTTPTHSPSPLSGRDRLGSAAAKATAEAVA